MSVIGQRGDIGDFQILISIKFYSAIGETVVIHTFFRFKFC